MVRGSEGQGVRGSGVASPGGQRTAEFKSLENAQLDLILKKIDEGMA